MMNMKKDTLVAINIVCNDKLLNPTKYAILFYWDGGKTESKEEMKQYIQKSPEILEIIKEKCIDQETYMNTTLNYLYYEYDGEDKYIEDSVNIYDIVNLSECNENIWIEFVKPIFVKLYNSVWSKTYVWEEGNETLNMLSIYDDLKIKYKSKMSKAVVINYIRSQLDVIKNISLTNKDFIIRKLEELFKFRQ